MALEMRRGRLQSLFAYLPEQTYNWENNRGRFKGSSQVDTRPLDIPQGWIKRPLLRLLRGFAYAYNQEGVNWSGENVVKQGNFELLEPRTLRGEYYPRTFICSACGRSRESDDNPRYQRCSFCNEIMPQLRFVEYHRCGHIDGLKSPRCKNGCNDLMMLRGPNGVPIADARAVTDWRWRCSGCERRSRGVIYGCRTCRKGTVRVLPSDASQVYYPQYITVINPPSQADYQILESPSIYPAAIAQSLGLLPKGVDSLKDASDNVDSMMNRQTIRKTVASLFGLDIDNPAHQIEIDQETDRILSRRQSHSSPPDWEGVIDSLVMDDEEAFIEIGEECISLALALEAGPVTISDLVCSTTDSGLESLYDNCYPKVLERFGLASVTLLQEFPIAHVVAGYTREEFSPGTSDGLLDFNFFQARQGKYPMYGQRVTTEALLFQLSPDRVISWIMHAGLVDEGKVDSGALNWIFSNLLPVDNIFEAPNHHLTASILGLIHTFSHSVIRSLARLSGLKVDSLSEYMFPYNLSFLIYPGARSEFVLGGLEHVFRNNLDKCLNSMIEYYRCVFDPPCSQRGGACSVCIYIGEVACNRFNTALSRHYLFGGNLKDIAWRGYWDSFTA